MATIDISTIEGFDGMTAEQKVDALLKAEIPEKVDLSLYVSKDTADKYATEAAELKKQLKSKMTDDEAAKAQADADRKELEGKYTELLRKSTIAEHTARYIAMRAMTRSWPARQQRRCLTAIWSGSLPTSRRPTPHMRRSCGLIW